MPTIAPTAPAAVSARPSPTLATRRVSLGPDDSVTGYLAQAVAGDVATIRPGAVLTPLVFPASRRAGWVSVIATGVNTSCLTFPAGSHDWRVVGLEVARDPSIVDTVYDLVNTATGSSRIALEDLYIHGTPTGQTRRGLSMNGADVSITKSRIHEIHETGADSQGISGIHGPGPYLIEDYDIEAAGENIMFGGGDPSTPGLIPSDITIRRGRFWKSPTTLSGPWTRKNHLEFKNAQRVLVQDFIMEAFPGVAIVLTPRNQDGTAPWCTVRDLLIYNGRVTNVGSVLSGQTTDDEQKSAACARIAIRNLYSLNVADRFFFWSGGGVTFDDFEVSHCTGLPCRNSGFFLEGWGLMFRRFKLTDNLLGFGSYTNQAIDFLKVPGSIDADSVIRQNMLVNAGDVDGGGPDRNQWLDSSRYISIPDAAAAGLDLATGTLAPTSPYIDAATDGGPIGYVPPPTDVPVPVPDSGVSLTVPAGDTVIITRRPDDTTRSVLLTVNKSTIVTVNGTRQ